jgi:hypothetical protein
MIDSDLKFSTNSLETYRTYLSTKQKYHYDKIKQYQESTRVLSTYSPYNVIQLPKLGEFKKKLNDIIQQSATFRVDNYYVAHFVACSASCIGTYHISST